MTDKIDIAALREECAQWVNGNFGDLIDTRMALNGDGTDYMAWDMAVLWRAWSHLSGKLETERQRADAMQSERDEFRRRLKLERSILEDADNELAALRGAQEPVAMDDLRDAVAEMSGGLPMEWRETTSKGHHGVPFINFNSLHRIVSKFTRQPNPVVLLSDCDIAAVSHMAHWYSEEQCEAWVAGVEHAKKQILAAGIVVKDGE